MSTLRQQWLSDMAARSDQSTAPGVGSCFLADLCTMAFTGPDASEFLQGYLTCDTQTLTPNSLQPWALCNLQGRVVANGWCTAKSRDSIELIMHRSLTSVLAEFFKPYLMFSKTQLTSHADDVLVFGSLRTADSGVPNPGSFPVGPKQHVTVLSDLAAAAAIYHPNAQPNAWHECLIQSRICLITQNTSATFLPQMLSLEEIGAVSFSKGCYLGQEVVARAQHRGSVKRRLQQLRWQGSEPQPGDFLQTGQGQKAGTIINAVTTQPGSGVALAVVANDADGSLRACRGATRETTRHGSH